MGAEANEGCSRVTRWISLRLFVFFVLFDERVLLLQHGTARKDAKMGTQQIDSTAPLAPHSAGAGEAKLTSSMTSAPSSRTSSE